MPPVRMTRAEYEAAYGVKPVVATSSLDNDPIPVRMTRAEYNAMYRPELTQKRDDSFIGDLRRGGAQAVEAVNRGVERQDELNQRGFFSRRFGQFTTGLEAAGGALASLGEGVFRALPGGTTVADTLAGATEAGITAVSQSPVGKGAAIAFESLPEGVQTVAEDVGRGAMGALGIGGALVTPGATAAISRPVIRSADEVFQGIKTQALKPRATRAVERVASEISDIENKYSKTRAKVDRDPFVVESRMRIAQSNVLDGAVDGDGLIRTKQKGGPIEQYKNSPITSDGLTLLDVEDVVRRNLEVEAKTANINEVRANILSSVMDSGLEGADLAAAIRRVEKDLEGLAIRADEFGNVLLSKIQDAKISTTKNIDYTKPVGTTYRKTLARVYKEIIEEKSDLPIKEWNQELSKYYRDIDRLADLDGARVKGGRLGKLTASVTGSAIGAVAGTAGGGAGALVGGILGGEVAAGMASRAMSRTFSRRVDGRMPQSRVLAEAQAKAQAGVRDLKTADRPVGASKAVMADPNMPAQVKTQIVKVESQIKKNVKQQNDAIKKGDFTLVAALKDVYTILVDRLKQIISDYKKMTPGEKQGGFIGQNPFRKENQASDINAPSNAQIISPTIQKIDAEIKSNIVRILDDYTLNKNPDLELQMDAAKIAEDLGIKLPKTYGALVKKLGEVLDEAEAPKKVNPGATQSNNLLEEAKNKQSTQKVIDAFNKSTDFENVGDGFVIGSFGKNGLYRKVDKGDRLTIEQIKQTTPNIKSRYVATSDANNVFRLENEVALAEMPNGEIRAIVTRKNSNGDNEILTAFTVSKDVLGFIKNLGEEIK